MRALFLTLVLLVPVVGAIPLVEAPRDAGQPGDAPTSRNAPRMLPGPGDYEGWFGTLDPADAYGLLLSTTAPLRIRIEATAEMDAELYSPSGALVRGGLSSAGQPLQLEVGAPEAGRWVLRLAPRLTFDDYRFGWSQATAQGAADPVVVATLDSGVNPWHPCWREGGYDSPVGIVPGYPASAQPLALTFASTYEASARASGPALSRLEEETLYHVQGTRLSYYAADWAPRKLVDRYPHGAMAATQIACPGFGLAPDAHVVVLNWADGGGATTSATPIGPLAEWAAQQPWIDIVHVNAQDWPVPVKLGSTMETSVRRLVEAGKLVVIAGGNGVGGVATSYPEELSRFAQPGVLVAGAVDDEGYTSWSNYDPHVVMDGVSTWAGEHDGFGKTTFGGTSSSSPRVAGYVARVLGELRRAVGHDGVGLLTIPAGSPRPAQGPLADGTLSAQELHLLVRKSADADLHFSFFDGETGISSIPEPGPVEERYAFVGYGEVSERTVEAAVAMGRGEVPIPARPEDAAYERSESLRRALWG